MTIIILQVNIQLYLYKIFTLSLNLQDILMLIVFILWSFPFSRRTQIFLQLLFHWQQFTSGSVFVFLKSVYVILFLKDFLGHNSDQLLSFSTYVMLFFIFCYFCWEIINQFVCWSSEGKIFLSLLLRYSFCCYFHQVYSDVSRIFILLYIFSSWELQSLILCFYAFCLLEKSFLSPQVLHQFLTLSWLLLRLQSHASWTSSLCSTCILHSYLCLPFFFFPLFFSINISHWPVFQFLYVFTLFSVLSRYIYILSSSFGILVYFSFLLLFHWTY